MALSKQDLKVVAQLVSSMLNERPMPIGVAAHVVPGSYRQGDGTVEVAIDDSDAAYQMANALGDAESTQWLSHPRVPIAGIDPNDQYGFRGTEPVMLFPSQRGFVALAIADAKTTDAVGAGPFYSVKAPSGERWIMHRNASGDVDSAMQLTDDGPTAGDGLGGTTLGGSGALTQAQTASGHVVSLNDTEQTITVQTASAKLSAIYDDVTQQIKTKAASGLYTLYDGANNVIEHVVPTGGTLALGDTVANLGSAYAAVNQKLMNAPTTGYSALVNNMVLGNLQAYITALTTSLSAGGLPNPGAFSSSMIAIIIGSWLAKVASFTGSQIVQIAS